MVHCKNIALSSNIPKTKKNKQTKAESTYSSSRPWIMRRFLKNVRLVNSGLCRSTTNAPVISCTDSNTENCSKRASGVLDDSLSNVHTISHEYYVKSKTVQKYATNTNCIESLTAVYLLQFSTTISSQFLLMNSRDCPNFVKISQKGFFSANKQYRKKLTAITRTTEAHFIKSRILILPLMIVQPAKLLMFF